MSAQSDFERDARNEAEAGILGVLIWLPNFARPRLEKVDFELSDPRNRIILDGIRELHRQGKAADLAGVLAWLEERRLLESAGGKEYLVQLVDTGCYNGAYRFDGYLATLRESSTGGNGENGERKVDKQESSVVGSEQPISNQSVSEESAAKARDRRSADGGQSATVNQSAGSNLSDRGGNGDSTESSKGNEGGQSSNAAEGLRVDTRSYGNGAELLDELRQLFQRYLVLVPWAAEVLALWTLHTYVWRLRSVTTYLGIVSPVKRCGKTTLLTLLDEIGHQTEFASNVSPPSIYRVIEETRPTLLIDEGDTFLRARDELRGILNAGYTKESAYVLRATGEGQMLRRYSCWCPKVIATIGLLPETLADRCVIITMRRKKPGEKCARLRGFDGSEIREKCARWVEQNGHAIERCEPAIPEALNDRAADIREPLLVLADLAGGTWPEVARAAAISFNGTSAEMDFTIRLLNDIQAIFGAFEMDKLFTRQLVEALTRMAERPWREIRRGSAINELWLAQQLSPFGIHSRTLRIGDSVGRGYCLEDFRDAFGRYLPKAA